MTDALPPLPDLIDIDARRPGAWVRALLVVGGVLAIAVGVVVWLVPVLTGAIVFYVIGLALLGRASRRAALAINALDRKLPRRVRTLLRVVMKRRASKDEPPRDA